MRIPPPEIRLSLKGDYPHLASYYKREAMPSDLWGSHAPLFIIFTLQFVVCTPR